MLRRLARRLRRAASPEPAAAPPEPRPVPAGMVRVTAAGRRDPRSLDEEVILVQAITAQGGEVDLVRLAGADHELMGTVHVGRAQPLPCGIRLTTGRSIELPLGPGARIALVAHPWSGAALIETSLQQRTIDLFAEQASLVQLEVEGLLPLLPPVEAAPMPELEPEPEAEPEPPPVPAGVVRVTAAGRRSPRSFDEEVILVQAVTARGIEVDLQRLAGDGHELLRTVHVGRAQPLPFGIRLTAGRSIELPLGPGGRIALVTHPWSGTALIETALQRRTVDLFAEQAGLVQLDVEGLLPLVPPRAARIESPDTVAAFELAQELVAHMERLALRRRSLQGQAGADVLAIYTPRWKGVTAATLNLFPCALPVPLTPEQHPDDLDAAAIAAIADAIAASPFERLVFSGGDAAYVRLFEACRLRRPALDVRLLWHSSYMQMGEPHDWGLLLPWLAAAQARRLTRFGVVKPGMERFLGAHGVDAVFVQNAVPFRRPAIPAAPRAEVAGIWLSGSSDYRKPVAPSLLAVAGRPGLKLRAAGLGELGCRIVDELRIPIAARFASPIPHADVLAQMRQTAVTLYVTLSECMPMVPLESIAQGAPCIVGPATELFTDDPCLDELLVVRDPTDPAAIRRCLDAVLDDRVLIQERCEGHLERLNARSEASLGAFLG